MHFECVDVLNLRVQRNNSSTEFFYGNTAHFRAKKYVKDNVVYVKILYEPLLMGRIRIRMIKQLDLDGKILKDKWCIKSFEFEMSIPASSARNFTLKVNFIIYYEYHLFIFFS